LAPIASVASVTAFLSPAERGARIPVRAAAARTASEAARDRAELSQRSRLRNRVKGVPVRALSVLPQLWLKSLIGLGGAWKRQSAPRKPGSSPIY
jgi:hypothetical protein